MGTSGPIEEILEIDERKIKIDDIQDNEIESVINYIDNLLKQHIQILDQQGKGTKRTLLFSRECRRILKVNTELKLNILPTLNEKSDQYRKLLKNIYKDLYYTLNQLPIADIGIYDESYDYYNQTLSTSLGKIKNLSKIEAFSENKNRGIIIVGGNGTGKSSFIGFLKDIYSNEMIVIPSQKLLIYDNNIVGIMQKKDEDIKMLLQENIIQQMRSPYQNVSINNLSSNFSTLVSVIANKTILEQNEYFEKKKVFKSDNSIDSLVDLKILEETKTILDKVNYLWSKIIKDITFHLDTENHCLVPYYLEREKYNINSMSDGEKTILYYIGNILLAEKCSYIVIDEPETYLNPSVYRKLWDILEEERSDCQFIYITHEVEFLRTRKNMDLFWMKKYNFPNDWDIVPLEDVEIPKELLIEIYGSKNRILFCEGSKDSIDYVIYYTLFGHKYSIVPVGSCIEVCKYTKVFNRSSAFHNNEAIGIIDYDNRSSSDIMELKKDSVYVTKYNEIEMLLLDEKVIEHTLNNFEPDIIKKKIEKFKTEFTKKISEKKEEMAFDFVKKILDNNFQNYRIVSKKIEELTSELQQFIVSYDYEKEFKNFLMLIEQELKDNNYENLLKYCNLKKEISKGLSNKELVSEYELQAIGTIKNSLSEYVRNKYFDEIDC